MTVLFSSRLATSPSPVIRDQVGPSTRGSGSTVALPIALADDLDQVKKLKARLSTQRARFDLPGKMCSQDGFE